MTQEQKAKAYDEALEKAKAHINSKGIGDTVDLCKHLFSELRGSEDERIRKAIVKSIEEDSSVYEQEVSKEQMLAWLEKQKEYSMSAEEVLTKAGLKPYKDGNQWCILAGDNIQEGICGFGDTIDEALYQFLMEVLEKQKEQKPAWSEEDETHLGWIIECFVSWKYQVPEFADHYQSAIDWLKSLRPQPKKGLHPGSIRKVDNPMKWMEEDEKEREQKPVTWSEEDEKRVKEAIKRIDELEFLGIHCNNVRKVLESLRPSWKPSEEQMNALNFAITYMFSTKANPTVLRDLYNDLLKLK